MLQAIQELTIGAKVKIQSGEACYVEIEFEKVTTIYDEDSHKVEDSAILYGQRIVKKVDGAGQPTGRYSKLPFRLRVSKINSIELPEQQVDIADAKLTEKNLIIIPNERLQS